MKKLVTRCPFCGGQLAISRLTCGHCDTEINSVLPIPAFFRLPPDLQEFVLIFLRCEGKIRDVETELGISYPTVRSRLETLLRALGLGDGAAPPVEDDEAEPASQTPGQTDEDLTAERRAVLERLARHELTADEAATAIRALGRS